MVFVSCVTPIMHPFWRREEFSASREIETIMFWKNVALFGALAMHVGMSKEEAKEEKEKEEYRRTVASARGVGCGMKAVDGSKGTSSKDRT